MTPEEQARYDYLMSKPMALLTDSDLAELRKLAPATQSDNTSSVDGPPLAL